MVYNILLLYKYFPFNLHFFAEKFAFAEISHYLCIVKQKKTIYYVLCTYQMLRRLVSS